MGGGGGGGPASIAASVNPGGKNSYTAICNKNFYDLFNCLKLKPDNPLADCLSGFSSGVSEANRLWNKLSEKERAKIRDPAQKANKAIENSAAAIQQTFVNCLKKGEGAEEDCEAIVQVSMIESIKGQQAKICSG